MNFKIALLAASAAAMCVLAAAPVQAARVSNSAVIGAVDATASSTFATTSYADLPAATITFTPQVDPNRSEAPGTPIPADNIVVEFTADVSKATATTGTCAVFLNGAIVAKTARTIASAAGEGSMAFVGALANTTTGSQTLKVQCKSGDTNTFTVLNAHLRATESY
jgi:hypothetical protein